MNTENLLMKQYRENLDFLIELKNYIGNIDNRIHDSATVLVLDYLKAKHPEIDWDFKMGSQTGIDIEGSVNGKPKVIAEIKTTKPYGTTDFGAQQKITILKDLNLLESAYIENKYFFVIDTESFNILLSKYQEKFPSVKIINILNPNEKIPITKEMVKNEILQETHPGNDVLKVSDNNNWDIEINLTEGPIGGYFFNIPQKYQHLIQEGGLEIINDSGEIMHCNTVPSMGRGRIAKNLNNWYRAKKFQPNDRFYLKKLDENKFKVVNIRRYDD